MDSLHPRSMRASWWSPPVLQGEAVKIFFASVSCEIHAMWPNNSRKVCSYLAVCLKSVAMDGDNTSQRRIENFGHQNWWLPKNRCGGI